MLKNNYNEIERQEISDVLMEWIENGKSFTATDLKRKLRSLNIWIDQSEVRDICKEFFDLHDDYDSKVIALKSNKETIKTILYYDALVYDEIEYDPNESNKWWKETDEIYDWSE